MLEGALEGGVDGAQIVGADGRAIDAVPVRVWFQFEIITGTTSHHLPGSAKGGIEHILRLGISHALNFVEVVWIISRQGAVQARLQERCPVVAQHLISASIILADTGNA